MAEQNDSIKSVKDTREDVAIPSAHSNQGAGSNPKDIGGGKSRETPDGSATPVTEDYGTGSNLPDEEIDDGGALCI